MSSLLSENLSCMNGEGVDDDDVLKHNSFLLMSLLEETTQGDQLHYNDEELHNMIRSLEAEINTNKNPMEEQEQELLLIDDVEFMNSQDYCSEYSINELDHVIPWDIDDDPMEQMSSSSPSDELNSCMDYFCGNDDQFSQLYHEVPSEHHLYYSSVWNETLNDTVI